MKITRCPENPIVTPGVHPWRQVASFNPAVIYDHDTFYMIERAAGSLRPFHCCFGLLKSSDGVHFSQVGNQPIITPWGLGFPYGSIQDPRLVKLDGRFYLNYAVRPSSYGYSPTGIGKPDEIAYNYPGEWSKPENFRTRSGIMVSDDLLTWTQIGYTTPSEINDRDNILFPEKINGRYALLRRPEEWIGPNYGTEKAGIWLSYSEDLITWTPPVLIASAQETWQYQKIGGSTPPIRTEQGWLTLFHGVDIDNIYRVGALMLELKDPSKVIARAKSFIMEPSEYYEKFGLYIPNVIFPTGVVVKDKQLHIFYGVTDTAIAKATVPLADLVDFVMQER